MSRRTRCTDSAIRSMSAASSVPFTCSTRRTRCERSPSWPAAASATNRLSSGRSRPTFLAAAKSGFMSFTSRSSTPQAHHVVVQRDRLATAPERAHVEMVLQIRADAGRLVHDRNAVALEQRPRTHAGELEKLRRVERAAAKDDFSCADRVNFAVFPKLDSDRAAIPEVDPGRQSVDFDLQIRPLLGRPQVADRGAAAAAAGCRCLVVAGAFLRGAVEVVVPRNAQCHGRRDEGVAQLVAWQIRHRERSADAMPGVRAAALVLRLPEVREEIVETPARDRPAVEVLALAADIDQAVDRGGAAENFAARREDAPVVQRRLGLRLVRPVDVGAREQLAVAERHVDPEVGVARPGFEEKHAAAAAFGEPAGEDATRGPGPDDDVIERIQTVAIGVAGGATGPGRRAGWAGRRKPVPARSPQPRRPARGVTSLPRWLSV